ncbi:DMT family transporter [Paracoccus sp. S-4012]|uniref:DMT family transporter n=1 Tax=Paracoccus sp. S-4012 TaxID=2665648 RepID=UPI001E4F8FD2|nr:DMT family transporter [Paracoccus sp. S-4012]
MLVNALIYSLMVMIIKAVAPEVPLFVIMFFSVATQFAFISGRAVRRLGPLLMQGERRWTHLLRSLALMLSMLTGFYAVAQLPLAVSTSISFSKAMFVTLFAGLFLAEATGIWRWAAVLVGFSGVLILSDPTAGQQISVLGLAAGVVSAAAAAAGAILTRRLAQTDPAEVLLLNQTAIGTLILAPLAIWSWQTPEPATLMLLVATGLLSVLGNTSMIGALRVGEASVIAPVDFSRAIFAGVLGYLVFSEVPNAQALAGMAIIALGTLMSLRSGRGR